MKSGSCASRLLGQSAIGFSLGLSALAGCGTAPQAAVPMQTLSAQAAPARPHIAAPPTDIAAAVPGEMVVKFKPGQQADVSGADKISDVAGIPGAHVYKLNSGVYNTAAVSSLADDPRIAYAEPRYLYHIADSQPAAAQDYFPPQASQLTQLWGVFKIDAPAAWAEVKGSPDVIVADVDTGVDYTHPDLAGGIIKGPNLVAGNEDPMDDHGHGTHTAGTIAANGQVVGVAFGVKVLAIKVLDSSGSGAEDVIAQGIDAAVKDGAKVINLSLGGPSDSYTLRDAIANATSAGALCVVAAGNDHTAANSYPAADPGAFAVGSVDLHDTRSYFSNYGTYVKIAAPGENILSTYLGGGYEQMSGTSMATPHVAGAAALLLSRYPDLTVSQLEQALTSSGDPVSGFARTPAARRLNVKKALDAAATVGPAPSPSPTTSPAPGSTPAPSAPLPLAGVSVVSRHTDGATIAWHTDVPTLGTLSYGSTNGYGQQLAENGYALDHQLTITGLSRWHQYHFQVQATSKSGQQYVSDDQTFSTKLWWLFSLSDAPHDGD